MSRTKSVSVFVMTHAIFLAVAVLVVLGAAQQPGPKDLAMLRQLNERYNSGYGIQVRQFDEEGDWDHRWLPGNDAYGNFLSSSVIIKEPWRVLFQCFNLLNSLSMSLECHPVSTSRQQISWINGLALAYPNSTAAATDDFQPSNTNLVPFLMRSFFMVACANVRLAFTSQSPNAPSVQGPIVGDMCRAP